MWCLNISRIRFYSIVDTVDMSFKMVTACKTFTAILKIIIKLYQSKAVIAATIKILPLLYIIMTYKLTGHWYGLSPVWTRTWASNSCLVKNPLLHFWHWWSRINKCFLFLWSIKVEAEPKLWPHSQHKWDLSPVWTTWWTRLCWSLANRLSHISHLYGFTPII